MHKVEICIEYAVCWSERPGLIFVGTRTTCQQANDMLGFLVGIDGRSEDNYFVMTYITNKASISYK